MVWFRVDDTFAMHEKVMAAGNSAIGLWVRAGAWSMQQLTDGFVPDHVVRVLGTPKERRTLVEVSLWDEAESGIRFRGWGEWQPTKDQVKSARQAAAERQRHARERAKSRRESRRDMGVSHGPPDPTRPDPTHKEMTTSSLGAANAAPKRGTRIPDNFPVTDEMRTWATEHTPTLDVDRETAEFIDYWRGVAGAKGVKLDWTATWRNGMRKRAEWLTERQPRLRAVNDGTISPWDRTYQRGPE